MTHTQGQDLGSQEDDVEEDVANELLHRSLLRHEMQGIPPFPEQSAFKRNRS